MSASASALTRRSAAERAGVGGLGFDALYAALLLWFLGGIYLDGWAHNHLGDLETFFTPWHAVLYSGYGATAIALAVAILGGRSRGLSWHAAIPVGYGLAAAGAVVFAAAGAADMVWHELFGIEVGIEPLLSPTHLALATGGGLMATGPLRAGWARNAPAALARVPQLVSLLGLFSLFTFMTQFAHPFAQTFAFEAARTPSNADLYAMAVDGSRQTRLTTEGRVASGAWSPDGARLALTVSEPGKPSRVYLVSSDERRSLLEAPATLAAWSPEGDRIALLMLRDGERDLAVVEARGSDPRLLVTGVGPFRPAWSPDGRHIAYLAGSEGARDLAVVEARGGEPRILVARVRPSPPAWSPDGKRIAYVAGSEGAEDIYTVSADGADATRLTDHPARDFIPAWSPDGTRVAFTTLRDGPSHVYVADADGRNARPFAEGVAAAWSPDGTRIAYLVRKAGNTEVYVRDLAGGEPRNLSRSSALDEGSVAWSADGGRLLYLARDRAGLVAELSQLDGVVAVLLQSALLAGVILVALSRVGLPAGSLTVLFGANALLMSFMEDTFHVIPAAVVAGAAADLLVRRLRPSPDRPRAWRTFAFAVPALLCAAFFASQLLLGGGVAWSVHLWTGAIALAGISGLLIGYAMERAAAPA